MDRRILDRGNGIFIALEQHRRAEHAEARIHADEEIDRADIALDAAELNALDLAWNRAELASRVDLHLDAAAGGFLDFFLVEFDELMLRLVHRRGAEFHDEIGGDAGAASASNASAAAAASTRRLKAQKSIVRANINPTPPFEPRRVFGRNSAVSCPRVCGADYNGAGAFAQAHAKRLSVASKKGATMRLESVLVSAQSHRDNDAALATGRSPIPHAVHQHLVLAAVDFDHGAVDEEREVGSEIGDEIGDFVALGDAAERDACRRELVGFFE